MMGRDGASWSPRLVVTRCPIKVVAEVVGNPRTLDPITCMTMLMSLGPSADLWMYSYPCLIYWARWSFAHASTVWATV